MRKLMFLFFVPLLLGSAQLFAQDSPVQWSFEAEKVSEKEYEIVVTARIQEGWSVYSQEMKGDDGPIPTQIMIDKARHVKVVGDVKEIGRKKKEYDAIFDMELVKLTGRTSFRQRVRVNGNVDEVRGQITFMTCCESSCLPPKDIAFAIPLD